MGGNSTSRVIIKDKLRDFKKLNIGRAIKRMTANELRDFIYENYHQRIGFPKKTIIQLNIRKSRLYNHLQQNQ